MSRKRITPARGNGWKFRVKVLDEDLTIRAVNGIAHIMQDDLKNTYNLCGGGSCNYKP